MRDQTRQDKKILTADWTQNPNSRHDWLFIVGELCLAEGKLSGCCQLSSVIVVIVV